jgi:multiple sugar transport system permease protein
MSTVATRAPAPVRPVPPAAGGRGRGRDGRGGGGRQWWIYAMLIIGVVIAVAPFLWMLLSSFKTDAEVRQVPPTWWPENPTLDNYRDLFQRLNFPRFFANSVNVATAVTLGNMVFCTMLGYALAKLQFPGRRMLFALVLSMLMIPTVATFVPLFVLVSNFGLANTFGGLILPFLAAPLGVFIMRQYILGLPVELLDAARIDGAGEFRILAQVVVPLCGPPLATLGVLTFFAQWNNFLWPLVVAQTEDKYTLPVALALYAIGQNNARFGLLMAGAVVIIIPVLIIFAVLQRYVVQGIAVTGLKD